MPGTRRAPRVVCHPLTDGRWADFEKLFGKNGAYAGCWCMWWRIKRAEFDRQHGAGTKRAMRRIVRSGEVPGILAYIDDEPAGWCSIAPRERFEPLERSPVLKRLDDRPVWSIVCLFVARAHRGNGMTEALIRGAVDYARDNGARLIESYPTVPKTDGEMPPVSSFMGLPKMYERCGFREQARPSARRAIMRRAVRPTRKR